MASSLVYAPLRRSAIASPPEPFLDLGGGALLRELERDAGRGHVDQCPVDGTQVRVRGEQQVARHLGTHPDGDRERVALDARSTIGAVGVGVDQLAPALPRVRRRTGDEPVHIVLDDDAAAEVLGEDCRDAIQPVPEHDLLGEPLLDRQRPSHLVVRLGERRSQPDLVLVSASVVDGDRGMAGECREDVVGTASEGSAISVRVDVDGPDRFTPYHERRAQDRAEVVRVQGAGPVGVCPVVRHLDRATGEDRLGGYAIAERKLQTEDLRAEVPDRDDAEHVALAVPEEDVAAVRAQQGRGVPDDRRQHGLHVERLGDLAGGREQAVEPVGPTPFLGLEDGSRQVERHRLETRCAELIRRVPGNHEPDPAPIAGAVRDDRPRFGASLVALVGSGADPVGHPVRDRRGEEAAGRWIADHALDRAVHDRPGCCWSLGRLSRPRRGAPQRFVDVGVRCRVGLGPLGWAGGRALDHRSKARASLPVSRRIPASAE